MFLWEQKRGKLSLTSSSQLLLNATKTMQWAGGGSEIICFSKSCINWINVNLWFKRHCQWSRVFGREPGVTGELRCCISWSRDFFTLCFVQHLTLGGLAPKEVMMWPKRTWMRLQMGKEGSQTPVLCTLPCGQLTSLNTALNTTFRPVLRVVVKYLCNNQYSFRLLAYFKPTSPISLSI